MALTFNSNNITTATWNGNSLTQINWNGVKVWPEVTPVEPNYFYIKNNDAENSYQFYFNAPNGDETAYTPELYYSTDKTNWTQYYLNTTVTLTPGQKCYFKAGTNGNNGFSTSETDCWHFQHNAPSAGIISIGGDLSTVMNENGGVTNAGYGFNFCGTFRNDGSGVYSGLQWPKIGIDNTFVIPFTSIGTYAFSNFSKAGFHSSFFPDLSHLQNVGSFGLFNAFNYNEWATAVTVDLTGVTTISGDTQFQNLMSYASYTANGSIIVYLGPAITGTQRVYRYMFREVGIPMEVHVPWTSWPNGYNSTQAWLESVTGTFYCPQALGTNETITRDNNHCPSGMTVVNTD